METQQVEDSVAKVNNELAVGEDLRFQRRWWTFERWVWRFFALVVLADLLGAFGRGPLAHVHKTTHDGAMEVSYERIERFSTPSILSIHVSPAAVHGGKVFLWVSASIVERLGNQRISPQPESSKPVRSGVIYTFPTGPNPSAISFALQPAYIGMSHFTLQLLTGDSIDQSSGDSLTSRVFVMP